MKILIGADLVPTDSNERLFREGQAEELLGDKLCAVLESADFRVFNLEVPLTDTALPIEKCGPNLIAPTDAVSGYKAMGTDLLTLANNHILDQGVQGLEATCDVLTQAGIAWFGAGASLAEAVKPYILDIDGKRIGFYACSEHEFSIATDSSAGANPFDPLESLDHVVALKQQCDYVVVLYHGGKEHYRYPSPNLQKLCRKLVQKGADLVLCQHSHCIGCCEEYQGATIIYGQGNFLFDRSESEYWQTGLLVQIEDEFRISYIPLTKNGNVVRLAEGEYAQQILEQFEQRSEEIKTPGVIEDRYAAFAESMRESYLVSLSGIRSNFLFRLLNKLSGYRFAGWFVRHRFKKDNLLAIQNYVECEAHVELLLQGIGGTEK